MHCGNCATSVENQFKNTEGVISVVVNLASNLAIVTYDQSKIDENKLIHVLDKTNFSATLLADTFDAFSKENKLIQNKKLKLDLIKLIVAVVLTVIVLLLHYLGKHSTESNILMLILTIPVQF